MTQNPTSTIIICIDNNVFNNNNNLKPGTTRFIPHVATPRRGLLPPILGGNSKLANLSTSALPIPSSPALFLTDTSFAWRPAFGGYNLGSARRAQEAPGEPRRRQEKADEGVPKTKFWRPSKLDRESDRFGGVFGPETRQTRSGPPEQVQKGSGGGGMVDVQERADEGVTKGRVASRKRAQEMPGENR